MKKKSTGHVECIDIYKARKRLKNHILKTPIIYSEKYSEYIGGEVYLKLENIQKTSSFKIRGVLNKIIKNNLIGPTWVTASAGNHGKALAYASQLYKNKAIIYVPRNTPINKKKAIINYGALLKTVEGDYDEAEKNAKQYVKRNMNSVYISPYNDKDIIEGQGTIALEIIEDHPMIDSVIVPVGGGGLISGISIALKSIDNAIEVIGVQSEASPAMYESIIKGRIVKTKLRESIADGLHGNIEEDSITFDIVNSMVDKILLVDETTIKKHIANIYYAHHLIIEGAAATTLAALDKYREHFHKKRVCAILSGGNIDHKTFINVLKTFKENY